MSNVTKMTTGKVTTYDKTDTDRFNVTMQLFGLPYQFLPSVDQRVPGVSSTIGRKYIENIMMDSAIVTIIPGEPRYLPGVKDKTSMTNALISGANDSLSEFKSLFGSSSKQVRLYDFQSAYQKYFAYVNVLCRSCAAYMELGESDYQINKKKVNFLKYDWKNYRWNGNNYHSIAENIAYNVGKGTNSLIKSIINAGSSLVKNIKGDKVDLTDPTGNAKNDKLDVAENVLKSSNFIQFYCEADNSRGSESLSNSTQQSVFKQMLDQGSSTMRDIAFMANTGGIDTRSLSQLGDAAQKELSESMGGVVNSTAGGIVSRILSAGKSVIKGENIMMPDIWSGSDNSKSYNLTFKFKAPYGNKLSLYTDVIVPTMHCVALAYPRATGANSYSSPPLVKVYQKGAWSCNLGIVSGIEIVKDEVPESWNVDGLATEVTVNLTITDLYSDIALSPANDSVLFANNTSLVEFLATTCGLDLVEPQISKKISNMWNMSVNTVAYLPKTAMGRVTEDIDRVIASFTGL